MREIAKTFKRLKAKGEGGLIAYVTAGDPKPSLTSRIVEAIIKGGADIIELGIPFSDPIADGPTIQAATVRALKAGTTPKQVLDIAGEIKKRWKKPLVILTYYNPIFRMGLKNFFEYASKNDVDGVIVPDLPIEEADEYKKIAESYKIDTIFLATPSTSTARLKQIVQFSSGFLYLVSVFGVTGTRKIIHEFTLDMIKRAVSTTKEKVSLAVGFGISKPEHIIKLLKNGADAAIVGSGFVRIIEEKHNQNNEMIKALEKYTKDLKTATKKTR
jgi:tryptophan synthase alpha chain